MRVKHIALAGLGVLSAAALASPLLALEKAAMKEQVASTATVSFDVFLPQQHRDQVESLLAGLHDQNSPSFHKWLTPEQFQERFGIPAASITAMEKDLSNYGLTAAVTSPHILHVTGTAGRVEQALGTELHHGVMKNGQAVLMTSGSITLPSSFKGVGAVVTGFSGAVRMRYHSRHEQIKPDNRYSKEGPYWFDDLKQAYTWPSYQAYDGKGSTVGILISGGYSPADMDAYFGHEKLATPKISEVDVLGGSPFDPDSDGSFEATLDVQQSAGMAPKAKIIVYSIPDLSDESIIAGLAKIISDNKTDVVSMSFGGAELGYAASFNFGVDFTPILLAEDDLMAEGNALGITFVASSGDGGALSIPAFNCFVSTDVPCGTFVKSAEFPASSPHVTGVGGTNLKTTYSAKNLNSVYISEEAFADPLAEDIFYGTAATGGFFGSGGGDSIVFKQPKFQKLVDTGNSHVRTVPDLALHMGGCPVGASSCSDDDSADLEVFGGYLYGVIGTSASAPDFAGLTALVVERLGTRVGNENYYVYGLAAVQNAGLYKTFHTRIPGFNGLYSSGNDGYNRVLGNGTIYGKDFILAPFVTAAGMPQTPSNP